LKNITKTWLQHLIIQRPGRAQNTHPIPHQGETGILG
jgi:hypothetical protein